MLIPLSEFAVTSVSFPKGPLDFVSGSQTMSPFLVTNQPSMTGWKQYTGHPPKISHLMHRQLRETQCVLQCTLTQTCSMIWLQGGLRPVCYISSTRLQLTPFQNDKIKRNLRPTVPNSWLLGRQLNRSSIYNAHFICLVCLLKDWLFGDNKVVITSSTIPHSSLNKHWNAISYHNICKAVAGGFICFEHISTDQNSADILTKSLPWHKARIHVEPLLFWEGETSTDDMSPSEGSDKLV